MRQLRIELTVPGFGQRRSLPDIPVPKDPAAPPSPVDAARQVAGQQSRRARTPFNIRNIGGAGGQNVASTARALKSLTGM